jgi:hypothetical protein
VKCFKYLGSTITDDGGVLVKLNPGLPWQKLHLTRSAFVYQQIGLKPEEETSEMLHLEHGFVWC